MKRLPTLVALVAPFLVAICSIATATDWPQFRHDAGRTATTTETLSETLHLQWTRELPTPRPAFPGEIRLRYDATYEPVVAGKTMFVPSTVTDTVTALDTNIGQERWQFFTEGPVRFAPAVWEGKVYFVSDDGHLYCVNATDGRLLWKFRGCPATTRHRKVMGNGRLVSLFPARGGPVLSDGIVYFAAGIWSGEGVFVHALDAKTGKAIWSNTDSNKIARANMDHGVAYYAGISPQGYLAIVDGKLVVPCGAQLPAILDLKTGELRPYTMGWGGRVGLAKGAWFVAGTGHYLAHGGDLYDIRGADDEQFLTNPATRSVKRMVYAAGLTRLQIDPTNRKGLGQFRRPVLSAEAMYYNDKGVVAYGLTEGKVTERTKSDDRRGDHYPDKLRVDFPELWRLDSASKVHIKAGDRLYCGRSNAVEVIDIPNAGGEAKVGWQAEIEGTPHSMVAANGKLFVVTREGRLYAFGDEKPAEAVVHAIPNFPSQEPDEWIKKAADILKMSDTSAGCVLVLGAGRLAEQIVWQAGCHVIVVDPDAQKVATLRKKFQRAGLYGTRISILVGDPASYPFPPYFASLIVSEDPGALGSDFGQKFTNALVHCLRPYGGTACLAFADGQRREFVAAVSGAKLAGVTARETDDLAVVTRNGPLPNSADWSHSGGSPANTRASLDGSLTPPLARLWYDGRLRWIRTPGASIVRIAGGRMFIHADKLYAIDIFTGRHLWQQPAGGRSDDRMVAVGDAIYLASGRSCAVLDPATGEKTDEINLPDDVAGSWSTIWVLDDFLVGACGQTLVCLNRRNGEVVWQQKRQAKIGGLALGGGKVFCADAVQKRRDAPTPDAQIDALDMRTGRGLWQASGGPEIRFCEALDLLCTSKGVYRGSDGERLFDNGVYLIAGDKLVSGTNNQAALLDPQTGKQIGKRLHWNLRGCTRLRGSADILTTRYMGNAAYVDIATGEITSIWNVRAACSNNLFPADGVLNVPNLSGGCTCNYMPISQALVPAAVVDRLAGSSRTGE